MRRLEVANTLGPGFLEKVYERALCHELRLRRVRVAAQTSLIVRYKGERVGDYYADLLVEGKIVVELKCVEHLAKEHTAQCLNYLKASGKPVCLLINFEKLQLEWKRLVNEF